MDALSSVITTIGFPIVMCLLMFKYMQDESANHKAEVDSLKESLKENTIVLADLKSMIKTLIDYMGKEDV